MRQSLVMGNWKMNGRRDQAQALLSALQTGLASLTEVEVAVCPPYPFLALAAAALGTKPTMGLGAQNLSMYSDGAYTGEVSGEMLRDIGCRFVIIGHSERRALFAETNEVVGKKFVRAREAGLVPVLCVGESAVERDAGQTEDVVAAQIEAVFQASGRNAFAGAVLAYEPVWAIGTGRAASPAEAQHVHAFIRKKVAIQDPDAAVGLRILYGGSVKAQNARELFTQDDIDGGLIGGAALDPAQFAGICRAALPV
ncbi:MAG TPA: triose-phosphate isomerase [Acidiferrobacter sp.]|nr:triose-phosphate isomerase [Acidiferrobacter sp.]